jgi:hypothetical protein
MKTVMYTLAAFSTLAAISQLATPLRADDKATARAALIGAWVQTGGASGWIIDSRPDGLHLTQIEGSGPVADFECNTYGQNCEVKIAGHKVAETLYYNDVALIQLETKGDQIVKRRFSVLPSGAMKVEITPMSGRLQKEELEFERKQPIAQK